MAAKTGTIGDIEVLRGVAVLFVMIARLHYLRGWRPAAVFLILSRWAYCILDGRRSFFCISGFVITSRSSPRSPTAHGSLPGRFRSGFGGYSDWCHRRFSRRAWRSFSACLLVKVCDKS
jgi:peptidoglycan/LPS O-acetylase OafA/YrhL